MGFRIGLWMIAEKIALWQTQVYDTNLHASFSKVICTDEYHFLEFYSANETAGSKKVLGNKHISSHSHYLSIINIKQPATLYYTHTLSLQLRDK